MARGESKKKKGKKERKKTHVVEQLLDQGSLVRLDKEVCLVQVLDDELVLLVEVDEDGLDGGLALDERACVGVGLLAGPGL